MEQFWAQVTPALMACLGTIVTALLGWISAKVIGYLSAKKKAVVDKIGVDQYNATYNFAKSIFFIVEEAARQKITETTEQKIQMFDDLLLKKVPSLTQEDLDHFRQAIAGQVNAIIKNSGILDPAAATQKLAALAAVGNPAAAQLDAVYGTENDTEDP